MGIASLRQRDTKCRGEECDDAIGNKVARGRFGRCWCRRARHDRVGRWSGRNRAHTTSHRAIVGNGCFIRANGFRSGQVRSKSISGGRHVDRTDHSVTTVKRPLAKKPNGLLIVCDLDRELLRLLQARIESGGQRRARICKRGLCDGMGRSALREKERHGGAISRGEVRRVIPRFSTRENIDVNVARGTRRR